MQFAHKGFKKTMLWFLAVLVVLYLIAPLISGLLNYGDPEGPLIYPATYHEILHTVGRALRGKGKVKTPYDVGRPWFYGLKGKPIDWDKRMRELQAEIDRRERLETNGVLYDVTNAP